MTSHTLRVPPEQALEPVATTLGLLLLLPEGCDATSPVVSQI